MARSSREKSVRIPKGLPAPGSQGRAAEKLKFHAKAAPNRGEPVLEIDVPSDLGLKYAFIVRIIEAINARKPLPAPFQKNLELCLDEALKNAIVWGNGLDSAKKVKVKVWEEKGSWGFTISDQGQGFKQDVLPDYDSDDFLWLDRGRGIYILINYLSEVAYHDGGRTVLLRT